MWEVTMAHFTGIGRGWGDPSLCQTGKETSYLLINELRSESGENESSPRIQQRNPDSLNRVAPIRRRANTHASWEKFFFPLKR